MRAVCPIMQVPTSRDDLDGTCDVEVDGEAGDRLELVERAARVAEAAARDHRHGHAAGRDERREADRDLVADAAGRVLVDLHAGHEREIEHVARVAHRPVSATVSSSVMPRKKTAMSQRAHLVVGELARRACAR
jgi:hypothetical protein